MDVEEKLLEMYSEVKRMSYKFYTKSAELLKKAEELSLLSVRREYAVEYHIKEKLTEEIMLIDLELRKIYYRAVFLLNQLLKFLVEYILDDEDAKKIHDKFYTRIRYKYIELTAFLDPDILVEFRYSLFPLWKILLLAEKFLRWVCYYYKKINLRKLINWMRVNKSTLKYYHKKYFQREDMLVILCMLEKGVYNNKIPIIIMKKGKR